MCFKNTFQFQNRYLNSKSISHRRTLVLSYTAVFTYFFRYELILSNELIDRLIDCCLQLFLRPSKSHACVLKTHTKFIENAYKINIFTGISMISLRRTHTYTQIHSGITQCRPHNKNRVILHLIIIYKFGRNWVIPLIVSFAN
jgi:hypothetical protein